MKIRYFYLICFATYAKEFGPGGFEKSFVTVSCLKIFFLFNVLNFQWMDEHAYLRTMIEEGKDGLEWYRCKIIPIFWMIFSF